jgi:hypothetical protein
MIDKIFQRAFELVGVVSITTVVAFVLAYLLLKLVKKLKGHAKRIE